MFFKTRGTIFIIYSHFSSEVERKDICCHYQESWFHQNDQRILNNPKSTNFHVIFVQGKTFQHQCLLTFTNSNNDMVRTPSGHSIRRSIYILRGGLRFDSLGYDSMKNVWNLKEKNVLSLSLYNIIIVYP